MICCNIERNRDNFLFNDFLFIFIVKKTAESRFFQEFFRERVQSGLKLAERTNALYDDLPNGMDMPAYTIKADDS